MHLIPDTGRVAAGMGALSMAVADGHQAVQLFGWRGWVGAFLGACGVAILTGLPTAIVPNPWFIRLLPARTEDYVIWAATALLSGLLIGSFAASVKVRSDETRAVSAGALATLAIGCPICNKLVVLLLGTAGALTFFAPLQLYLGLASLGLLTYSLRLRARALAGACDIGRIEPIHATTPAEPGPDRDGHEATVAARR